jgi:hypothetical protein
VAALAHRAQHVTAVRCTGVLLQVVHVLLCHAGRMLRLLLLLPFELCQFSLDLLHHLLLNVC